MVPTRYERREDIIAAVFLKRTRPGLNLRAVGENPATADAAGISITDFLTTIIENS